MENFGSGLALGVGVLGVLAGIGALGRHDPGGIGTFIFGLECLVGALIYRSAKFRKLGIKSNSRLRLLGECFGVLVILFSWLGVAILFSWVSVDNFKRVSVQDPLPYIIGPLWALSAYVFAIFRNYDRAKNGDKN